MEVFCMKNSKRNRQRGKAHQRTIAKKVSGLNIGILGGADVINDRFVIECKSRKSFVGQKWYSQVAKETAKHDGKVPIVVIHVVGKRYENDFVLIKLKDFIDLTGGSNVG
jgi:hypothetical protein